MHVSMFILFHQEDACKRVKFSSHASLLKPDAEKVILFRFS